MNCLRDMWKREALFLRRTQKKTMENGASDWITEAKLFVRQADDSAVYITWNNNYLKAKKK